MENREFEMYQMTAERVKDDALQENRRLLRQLAEKEQSFEIVKQVHFNRNIDLRTLNDIIVGCTGCLHTVMFSNKKILSDLDSKNPIFKELVSHREKFEKSESLELYSDLIEGFTTVVYPVGTSDLVEGHHHKVKCIVMLYPTRLMDQEVLTFLKSFMIVNEVLINIVLTRERMLELIETDPLTKALNRLAWRESIQRYLYEKSPFFVLFLDIDNFKLMNDTYGHLKGDELLIFTAAWLKSQFRADDRVFRLGGDEFAVLGFVDRHDELILEEKLALLNGSYIHEASSRVGVNISSSMGCYITEGNLTELEIYAKVDELLYASKEKGRNAITVYSELVR